MWAACLLWHLVTRQDQSPAHSMVLQGYNNQCWEILDMLTENPSQLLTSSGPFLGLSKPDWPQKWSQGLCLPCETRQQVKQTISASRAVPSHPIPHRPPSAWPCHHLPPGQKLSTLSLGTNKNSGPAYLLFPFQIDCRSFHLLFLDLFRLNIVLIISWLK